MFAEDVHDFNIFAGESNFLPRNGLSSEMMIVVAETGHFGWGFPHSHQFPRRISPRVFFSPGWKPPGKLAKTYGHFQLYNC